MRVRLPYRTSESRHRRSRLLKKPHTPAENETGRLRRFRLPSPSDVTLATTAVADFTRNAKSGSVSVPSGRGRYFSSLLVPLDDRVGHLEPND